MGSVGDLTTERIALDPNTARPPFGVWIDLPSDFFVMDTHPATWKRSAEILLREAFPASRRLNAAERRSALGVIEQLVSQCQRGGVSVSLIRMGRLSDGQVASAGIELAWAQEKTLSSLGRVRDMLPRSGTTSEVRTPTGPAVIHRSRANAQVPGTATIVSMSRIQLFVPFPGTRWTLIVSTASAFPELTAALDTLIGQIAASIRAVTDTEATAVADDLGIQVGTPDAPVRPSPADGSVLGGTGELGTRYLDPGDPSPN